LGRGPASDPIGSLPCASPCPPGSRKSKTTTPPR
jgi:hypothetical protein